MTVFAIGKFSTNADMVLAAANLGYISVDDLVLDATYGLGVWWKKFRPHRLVTNDMYVDGADTAADFRALPYASRTFDVVAYDPPFKLNGTPTESVDARYGVQTPTRWQERMDLILDGIPEVGRVTKKYVLVKCQNQVCSGSIRWQTHLIWERAKECGLELEEELMRMGSRPQSEDRRQVHARNNYSTMMIFRKVS